MTDVRCGDVVRISWSLGAEKRARVVRLKAPGAPHQRASIGVQVARVDRKGNYTGDYGVKVRYLYPEEILMVEERAE